MLAWLFGDKKEKARSVAKPAARPVNGGIPKTKPAIGAGPVAVASPREPIVVNQKQNIPGVSARPIIKDAKDIPAFRLLTTVTGGKHAQNELIQGQLAAIETTDNHYIILYTAGQFQSNSHRSLRKMIERADGEVMQESEIESGAMRQLYANYDAKLVAETTAVFSAENPALTAEVERMVEAGITKRATDIHICVRTDSKEKTGVILFRIDSIMRVWDKFPSTHLTDIVAYMYTKLAEGAGRSDSAYNSKAMQACTVTLTIKGKPVRIRFQTVTANGGFDAVLRLLVLDKDDRSLTLQELGYSPSQCRDLDIASRKTVGVIVVAGVTGSGKSTTLKTLMTMSPRRHQIKAYSIEDPVEYKIHMVTQINVQRSSSDNSDSNPYLQAMKVIMRADPDVIMAGEVRDIHSCEMLQTMVQSGHQVMTTVHASSAIETVDRLSSVQMGLSRHTMSSKNFISALVYQKLIPKLCMHCRLPAEKAVPEDRLELLKNKFKIDTSKVYAANESPDNHCPHCEGHGVKGMTVAAEIIPSEINFLRLIREGKDSEAEELWRRTRKATFSEEDMTGKTAFEHGLYKVAQGLVDPRHLEDSFDPMESYQIMEIKA